MYVAITRARQRLYLSFSQTRMLHGQTRYSLRSRFLDELPEAALKWLTPRAQPRASPSWSEGFGGARQGGAGGRGDWSRGDGERGNARRGGRPGGTMAGAARPRPAGGAPRTRRHRPCRRARGARGTALRSRHRVSHRPERRARALRRRRDRRHRGQRRRRARAGQLRPRRREVAGAVGGATRSDRLGGQRAQRRRTPLGGDGRAATAPGGVRARRRCPAETLGRAAAQPGRRPQTRSPFGVPQTAADSRCARPVFAALPRQRQRALTPPGAVAARPSPPRGVRRR